MNLYWYINYCHILYVFRDALIKMKDVYEKNPQMGDPSSLQPKLTETMSNMDRLRMEIHKNEVRFLNNFLENINDWYNCTLPYRF